MIWSVLISVLSFLITIGVGLWQYRIYRNTKRNLKIVKDFFPEVPDYTISSNNTISTLAGSDIKSLMVELNQYIESNKGTTDFSIIQNKTERRTDTVYEKATAQVSFPTYIGLMGTFVGVLLGLFGFSILGNEETRIDNLVHGVMVSMATSLFGLWLTTRGNRLSAETKEILDTRKNEFYDFLQNSLMPSLGTSMVAALDRLKNTLGKFEPSFSSVISNFESSFCGTIELFKDTFDDCTKNFGKEFRENSKLLNEGVDKMSHSVELINSNVDNQRQLLEEIRSTNMWDTLNKFVEVSGILEQTAKHIEGLRDVGKMIEEQVLALMTAQEDYTKSLAVPKVLTERINNLLDRFSDFEKSINNLGHAINSTELLGTKEMQDIEKHLARIDVQNSYAKRYADKQTEELENFFKTQNDSMEQLNDRYHRLMEEHGEKLAEVMKAAIETLKEKRDAFMRTINEAFDVAEVSTQFSHLAVLPELKERLAELERQLSDAHGEIARIASEQPSKEDISMITDLPKMKQNLSEANELLRNLAKTVAEGVSDERYNKIVSELDAIYNSLKSYNTAVDIIGQLNPSELSNVRAEQLEDVHASLSKVERELPKIGKRIADLSESTAVRPTEERVIQGFSDVTEMLERIETALKKKNRPRKDDNGE
ncbi:MAG: hypothetical protein K5867_04570 [Bacteroidales bacterium]|nr:hypothetical protein [Bacteroidales bacterium]